MKPLVPYVRNADSSPHPELVNALQAELPDCEVIALADIPCERRPEATVAIVDGPSAEQLSTLPNLAFVQSTWAGVEELLPVIPDEIGLARMVDPQLGFTMAEAVLAWTLYLHRDMPRYAQQQDRHEWVEQPLVDARDRRVGVLGLGALGQLAAATLAEQRFDVAGWSRGPKQINGVASYHGSDGLSELLTRSDIVINLLPHTPETFELLDAEVLGHLPRGACFVNFGRGQTVDDDALLIALDAGQIDHAVLDVFTMEPLPDDHPYWDHPKVTVLPHISGPTNPTTAAVIAGRNVRRFLADGTFPDDALVDRTRGY